MRGAGILLHITSLPSRYGIGTFGKEARNFIDWLKKSKQKYWQILPLAPTGYGDSPYQSFSTFSGNPLLIDLDDLVSIGLINKNQLENFDFGANTSRVDFERVYCAKIKLLNEAYHNFSANSDYFSFINKEEDWLENYALFMAIKENHQFRSWLTWDKSLRLREPDIIKNFCDNHLEQINFWKFEQYIFYKQWQKLKTYANNNGVQIIGDIPVYVAADSSDIWANPNLFQLDSDGKPINVAGVPPDYFSATGQLWGNPLYNWENMKKDNYLWWIRRIQKSSEMYDVMRIDHFRAFDTYWSVPATETTAVGGNWMIGPRTDFIDAIKNNLGKINIIAEDLGEVFESVKSFLYYSGFPGMRVLQFGFNPNNYDNDHLPHNYIKNCVAYTGTHDNSTFKGWFNIADQKTRDVTEKYLKPFPNEDLSWAAIRALNASSADTIIIPMQDVLNLDDSARMNTPSTIGNNWQWRMKKGENTEMLAQKLADLAETYFR